MPEGQRLVFGRRKVWKRRGSGGQRGLLSTCRKVLAGYANRGLFGRCLRAAEYRAAAVFLQAFGMVLSLTTRASYDFIVRLQCLPLYGHCLRPSALPLRVRKPFVLTE